MFCCLDRSVAFARAVASFIAMAELICLKRLENDILATSGSQVEPATAFSGILEIKLTLEDVLRQKLQCNRSWNDILGESAGQVGSGPAFNNKTGSQVCSGTAFVDKTDSPAGPGTAVLGTFERQVGPGPAILDAF